MSIHVALNHVTSYRYDRPVGLSPQIVRLRPAPHCRTPILSYSLRVAPQPHFINWQQDPHSNYLARLVFPDKVREFRLDVDVVAEVAVYNPFDFFLEPAAEQAPFAYDEAQVRDLLPFLRKEPLSSRFAAYLDTIDTRRRRTIDFLVDLNQALQRDIRYVIRLEPGVQTKEETLEIGSGSCRDTAWLLVQLLRHLGLAARFVSGYLVQLAPDVKAIDGPSGPERDFTDLHAWCEVYLPGAGWIGLDPTSGLLAGEGHIPLTCTPEPASAAPVSGEVEESGVEFAHTMSVQRIYESPRVTRPYTDPQWQAIVALGHVVDRDLQREDVRLTMGGEPTFVAVDDPDGAEWTTAALGPTKRRRAADLLRRLKRHYGTHGMVHFGQGKWYPGEQLPRWALACYWRRDGEPIWHDDTLVADERRSAGDAGAGHAASDAERFIRALAARLGVTDAHVQAGYEDVWYYLWRERKLPVNVDPFDARLDDEQERDRLRKVFTQQLDAVVGHALPLVAERAGLGAGGAGLGKTTANATGGETPVRWRTGPWFLRAERMYLMPGDSAMGYRLPLDSLPWVEPGDYPQLAAQDPFERRPPLPGADVLRARAEPRVQVPGAIADAVSDTVSDTEPSPAETARLESAIAQTVASEVDATEAAAALAAAARAPRRFESATWITRTALCVEARGGVLYVFMPPVPSVEAYLDLVSRIEATAADLRLPVLLEGYPPPSDPRLLSFKVTPDPGVIEVNIHPAASWDALIDQTTTLYDEARQAGLTTEKFMLDGRHTGTGGGNHIVIGGATAADSPFLRRPDLLRSLIAYWHNHPSLSYLFSGLFIGPTSQAPRVDEARHDSVYELEIAFAQIPPRDRETPPWLVDRLFRHLLADATGNTHRAEFCIDKLYAPDSASGRHGLLEMRAFEMPPHARMSLVQQLLLRALVARFWREPYVARLTRWGTELHDRFMLPYFVGLDFEDVLAELTRDGYAFDASWFAPHVEFRFPLIGEVSARAVHVSVRQALEPWHVLGEESTAGGTARYVDSSVERVQVLVTGMTDGRYRVTCNGRALPLHPTGRNGEFVAGVRYRAWQPPNCLHPTIPVHTPLTFDLVDTWMDRSLGGCQYHVMHPGGTNPEQFPVNSFEAESRRRARFFAMGHTPGPVATAPPARSHELPYTLDLRTDGVQSER